MECADPSWPHRTLTFKYDANDKTKFVNDGKATLLGARTRQLATSELLALTKVLGMWSTRVCVRLLGIWG